MAKRAEIELGYRLKNASELTKFSTRLRQAFERAGQDAEKSNRRIGLLEKTVNRLPAKWNSVGLAAATALEKTSRAADRSWARLKGGAGTLVNVFGKVTRTVFSLKTVLVGLGLGYVGKGFLDVSREAENYATRLASLLGSQQKANQAMAYFQEVAAKVPFTLEEVVEAGTTLESFGADSRQWLNPLDDLAAVMGISLPEAAQALGRAYAGGAGAADIFRERGILQVITDAAKMQAGIDDITQLTLPQFRAVMLATFTDPGGKIAGASQDLATKWDGMVSMLSDKWYQFRKRMMDAGVFDLLKSSLQGLLDYLDQHQDTLDKWAQAAGQAVTELMRKGVKFVENIINNWEEYQRRWERFKSGAAEYWEKTKSVAATLSGLFTSAVNSWNSLPSVIREFGLVGALLGGKKAKLVFTAMMGLGYLGDKIKSVTDKIKQGGGAGASLLGGLESANSLLDIFSPAYLSRLLVNFLGRKTTATNAGSISLDATGTANSTTGSSASLAIDLGNSTPGNGGTSWNLGQRLSEKEIAAANAATHKQTQDYIAMIAGSVDLEKQLRQEGMNAQERNLAQLADRYEITYSRIEDLILAGVYSEEQADRLKAQLNQNYLAAVDKAQADHDQSLRRSIELYGKTGRELKLAQLDQELEDLRAAGHSAVLIEEYKAQRLEEINQGWLEKTLDYYLETENLMADGAKNAMQATQGAWADYIRSGLTDFESFCDAIEDTWANMLAQLIAQVSMSGFAGLLKDLLNLFSGKGFSLDNTLKGLGLDGLFGGGTSGGVAGTVVKGVASSAAWQAIKSGASSVAGALGLDSVATWLGGAGAQAALTTSGIASGGITGGTMGSSIVYSTPAPITGAASGSNSALSAGLGAALATPAGAMAVGLLPGMVGALFHDQISSLLGMDTNPMTPEEAISNWEGSSRFVETLSQKFDVLSGSLKGVDEQFGLFSDSAKDFAADFEHLGTVANYSQQQLAEAKAGLSSTAQAYLEGGQAARSMEGSLASLIRSMNNDLNSYSMTSVHVRQYNDDIETLAGSLGITGDRLISFRDKIWDLANSFSSGGEEASAFSQSLSRFVAATLGGITQDAGSATDAVSRLIAAMSGVGTAVYSFDSLSGGSNGYVGARHSGGVVDTLLSRLPKYHTGGDVLSWLQPGEFVVRRSAVNAATLPALRAINSLSQTPALSDGGSYRGDTVINVEVNLGDLATGVDVQAITSAATEGARKGALAALKAASEAGRAVMHVRGVYGQDAGY